MRKRRIPGTFVRSDHTPKCKQCLERGSHPILLPDGSEYKIELNGDEHVVSFMRMWVCKIHFRVDVKGQRDKVSLVDLFPNRQYRRQALGNARVSPA